MTWLGPTTRAYALCAAVDMRKGFDGLYGLATQTLGRDVLRGDLFLFVGRDRNRPTLCIPPDVRAQVGEVSWPVVNRWVRRNVSR